MVNTLRLGIFIVSGLLLLAVGTFLIGQRQFLFADTYRVNTTFKTVTGLTEGAEVRVGGIPKGIIKHITLPETPTGSVMVAMNLDKSTEHVLRADSIATIATEGLLGNKYVEITFGSDKASPLEHDATIGSEAPVDMNDMVKKAGDAMGDIKGQMASVTTKAAEGAAAFTENMEAMRHNFFLKGFFNNRGYEDSSKLRDNLITQLPRTAELQSFHYSVTDIFEDVDHAKLKTERKLNDAGKYLQATPFGTVVVVAAAGMKGDSEELEVMLQARAMVVREYLVKSFRMDDKRVKTMIQGKGPKTNTDDGTIDVIVFRR